VNNIPSQHHLQVHFLLLERLLIMLKTRIYIFYLRVSTQTVSRSKSQLYCFESTHTPVNLDTYVLRMCFNLFIITSSFCFSCFSTHAPRIYSFIHTTWEQYFWFFLFMFTFSCLAICFRNY